MALHLVQVLRPVVNLMKVLTGVLAPTHAEILAAMDAALEQAKLLLRGEEVTDEELHQPQERV